jgi:Arc/MetJ-type ribon-helix-helix transcriptional regulator
MTAEPAAFDKVSVTLPAPLLASIRERVGSRGLSAYVTRALEEQERLAALDELLAAAESQHGPVPEHALEEVRRRWPAARAVL